MQDIKDKLAESLAQVEWDCLQPHAKRDALIVVTDNLDLLDVGVKIAGNDVVSVQNWIDKQLIHKPSAEQITAWNQEQNKQFSTIIVQPFVLIQEANQLTTNH